MFEKVETRVYANADARLAHAQAFMWWQQQGFQVQETGPGQFTAASAARWGLRREAVVGVRDAGTTTFVELRMKAQISDEGLIAGGLALVFVWPVAVVGGAFSYAKYEEDAINLMSTFWRALESAAHMQPTERKEQVVHTTAIPTEDLERAQSSTHVATQSAPLTREQKLDMLEDRLARGEISEATYREIRARLG